MLSIPHDCWPKIIQYIPYEVLGEELPNEKFSRYISIEAPPRCDQWDEITGMLEYGKLFPWASEPFNPNVFATDIEDQRKLIADYHILKTISFQRKIDELLNQINKITEFINNGDHNAKYQKPLQLKTALMMINSRIEAYRRLMFETPSIDEFTRWSTFENILMLKQKYNEDSVAFRRSVEKHEDYSDFIKEAAVSTAREINKMTDNRNEQLKNSRNLFLNCDEGRGISIDFDNYDLMAVNFRSKLNDFHTKREALFNASKEILEKSTVDLESWHLAADYFTAEKKLHSARIRTKQLIINQDCNADIAAENEAVFDNSLNEIRLKLKWDDEDHEKNFFLLAAHSLLKKKHSIIQSEKTDHCDLDLDNIFKKCCDGEKCSDVKYCDRAILVYKNNVTNTVRHKLSLGAEVVPTLQHNCGKLRQKYETEKLRIKALLENVEDLYVKVTSKLTAAGVKLFDNGLDNLITSIFDKSWELTEENISQNAPGKKNILNFLKRKNVQSKEAIEEKEDNLIESTNSLLNRKIQNVFDDYLKEAKSKIYMLEIRCQAEEELLQNAIADQGKIDELVKEWTNKIELVDLARKVMYEASFVKYFNDEKNEWDQMLPHEKVLLSEVIHAYNELFQSSTRQLSETKDLLEQRICCIKHKIDHNSYRKKVLQRKEKEREETLAVVEIIDELLSSRSQYVLWARKHCKDRLASLTKPAPKNLLYTKIHEVLFQSRDSCSEIVFQFTHKLEVLAASPSIKQCQLTQISVDEIIVQYTLMAATNSSLSSVCFAAIDQLKFYRNLKSKIYWDNAIKYAEIDQLELSGLWRLVAINKLNNEDVSSLYKRAAQMLAKGNVKKAEYFKEAAEECEKNNVQVSKWYFLAAVSDSTHSIIYSNLAETSRKNDDHRAIQLWGNAASAIGKGTSKEIDARVKAAKYYVDSKLRLSGMWIDIADLLANQQKISSMLEKAVTILEHADDSEIAEVEDNFHFIERLITRPNTKHEVILGVMYWKADQSMKNSKNKIGHYWNMGADALAIQKFEQCYCWTFAAFAAEHANWEVSNSWKEAANACAKGRLPLHYGWKQHCHCLEENNHLTAQFWKHYCFSLEKNEVEIALLWRKSAECNNENERQLWLNTIEAINSNQMELYDTWYNAATLYSSKPKRSRMWQKLAQAVSIDDKRLCQILRDILGETNAKSERTKYLKKKLEAYENKDQLGYNFWDQMENSLNTAHQLYMTKACIAWEDGRMDLCKLWRKAASASSRNDNHKCSCWVHAAECLEMKMDEELRLWKKAATEKGSKSTKYCCAAEAMMNNDKELALQWENAAKYDSVDDARSLRWQKAANAKMNSQLNLSKYWEKAALCNEPKLIQLWENVVKSVEKNDPLLHELWLKATDAREKCSGDSELVELREKSASGVAGFRDAENVELVDGDYELSQIWSKAADACEINDTVSKELWLHLATAKQVKCRFYDSFSRALYLYDEIKIQIIQDCHRNRSLRILQNYATELKVALENQNGNEMIQIQYFIQKMNELRSPGRMNFDDIWYEEYLAVIKCCSLWTLSIAVFCLFLYAISFDVKKIK